LKKFLFACILITSIPVYSQIKKIFFKDYIWDVGLGIGASNYLGDIGGYDGPQNDNSIKDLHFKSTSFSLNAFARQRLTEQVSLKFDFTWARIKGADSLTQNWPERYARNLSFRTDIIEASIQSQLYILILNNLGKEPYIAGLYSYIGGGIGAMYYNPQARYNGKWRDLQPLNTEGKENQYLRFSPTIPLSFGMVFEWRSKYVRPKKNMSNSGSMYSNGSKNKIQKAKSSHSNLNKMNRDSRRKRSNKYTIFGKRKEPNKNSYRTHRLGIDFCYRITFTDYLDDISTDYPDLEEMDETSRNLSSRSTEVINDPRSGGIPIENYTTQGSPRGDPTDNDDFITITLTYSFNLNINNMKESFKRMKNLQLEESLLFFRKRKKD
tara:strand:+ start:2741 stop:3880 length:1140 start_codon:yes stop_codon:yes gene_type:complete